MEKKEGVLEREREREWDRDGEKTTRAKRNKKEKIHPPAMQSKNEEMLQSICNFKSSCSQAQKHFVMHAVAEIQMAN